MRDITNDFWYMNRAKQMAPYSYQELSQYKVGKPSDIIDFINYHIVGATISEARYQNMVVMIVGEGRPYYSSDLKNIIWQYIQMSDNDFNECYQEYLKDRKKYNRIDNHRWNWELRQKNK